ncbi:MAG: medium chain dehydrogenase/reductase family protein [Polyangiaceae bacterium]|jgi:NADPH:quinone reductase-like Zn-dependent oxidoreductase|nr:medium chain dehydrogenase/reductase family protein [Polyangiaceae bacterium]
MRQIWLTAHGPPEVLAVREAPDPAAAAGEVRVRVRAAGVNFADLLARLGLYPDAPAPPCVPGFEVAGVVDQVGAGVAGFREGDRVFATPRFGGYTDVLTVGAEYATRMPDAMGFEEAAAFPTVYLAAYHVMFALGATPAGSTVLVHSAAGGVGLAAVQLARGRGCRVLGTASPSKHDFLRAQGCEHPLDYADWPAAARRIVGDRGVDLAIDAIGGRSWKDSYDLLAPGGRLACLGASMNAKGPRRSLLQVGRFFAEMPRFTPLQLMNDNKQVGGFNLRRLFDRFEALRPELAELVALYERGAIKPHVDRTFRFDEAAEAHRWLHDRKAKGKLVLVP